MSGLRQKQQLAAQLRSRTVVEVTMVQAGSTYRAVQAVSPGKLELTEKRLLDPNPGHVRIRVEACG
ncbi:MAG TPA: hypothetical protein VN281_22995, partial [Verrucomicrobiae bacterium]|nr:hypothetical protein [Verrucomicrobiae bacterium]